MESKTGILTLSLLAVATAVTAIPVFSQTQVPTRKPTFEVISIRPGSSGAGGVSGDRWRMSGGTLRALLAYAYGENTALMRSQIIGAPEWWETDQFSVEARADCSAGPLGMRQVHMMVQSLLEDRFQLKAHFETREMPVYNLVVAKDGPKIKRSEDQTPPTGIIGGSNNPAPLLCPPPLLSSDAQVPQRLFCSVAMERCPRGGSANAAVSTTLTIGGLLVKRLRGEAVPIATLVNSIQPDAGRPVIDRTGLTGLFDYDVQYDAEPVSPSLVDEASRLRVDANSTGAATALDPASLLSTGLQQLGLKLESAKAPFDVLVIDSVQKPTEN
jgi:uncharacterized protein (TIGR03435 family)